MDNRQSQQYLVQSHVAGHCGLLVQCIITRNVRLCMSHPVARLRTPRQRCWQRFLEVRDLDIAPDCIEWLKRFAANGLPETTRYASSSEPGHEHYWYRLPPGGPVARINISKQYDIMSEGNAVAPGSIHPNGSTYTLLTELLPVEDLPLAPAWALDMLQARVSADRKAHTPEDWAELPSGATLAHSRRFQALCKVNDQLRAVCAGQVITLTTKHGGQDSSISIQRSVFVNQLLRAKFPHNEIRALAHHFSGVLESNPKAFQTDIDRLLFKYTPQDYKPESTGVIAQLAPRGGRHHALTAGELLDWLLEHADCGPLGLNADLLARSKAEIGRLKNERAAIGTARAQANDPRQVEMHLGGRALSPIQRSPNVPPASASAKATSRSRWY
jgi:hypothetical protein